jgi:DNA repair exonuclease SbcCD ATPase subunit
MAVGLRKKRSDVRAEVVRLAKQKYPELSEGAATARIWAERPDLREAHERASEAQEVLTPREPVQKGAEALAKRDAAVRELRKLYPEKSVAELRVMALEEDPSIYAEYRRLTAAS